MEGEQQSLLDKLPSHTILLASELCRRMDYDSSR